METQKTFPVVGAVPLTAALIIMSFAGQAHAASAVAMADDLTYGYSFEQPTEEAAKAQALRSCSRRTSQRCQVVVSCSGGGFGAISFSGTAGRRALGASCGATSVPDAYLRAQRSCNAQSNGRCGYPRVGWNDRLDGGES